MNERTAYCLSVSMCLVSLLFFLWVERIGLEIKKPEQKIFYIKLKRAYIYSPCIGVYMLKVLCMYMCSPAECYLCRKRKMKGLLLSHSIFIYFFSALFVTRFFLSSNEVIVKFESPKFSSIPHGMVILKLWK